jgi:NTE family protein
VSSMLEGSSILRKLFDLRRNRSELTEKFGINPGDAFHSWVRKRLAHYDIHSLADLDEQLAIAPRGIAHQKGEASIDLWRPKLAVVTTELSSGRKVVFPRHANLFYSTPNKASPADFVRASMSVPYFFEPFRIDPIPQSPAIDAAWDDFLDSSVTPGSLTLTPRAAMFVDGGLLSNFPISEFHRSDNKAPTMPTFGIKLGYDGGKVEPPKKLLAFTGRLISAMRYDADAEFLAKNQEYKHLIGRISTAGYHWLDFEMPPEDKIGLFYQGVIAGVKFLQTFNWKAYKAMRS